MADTNETHCWKKYHELQSPINTSGPGRNRAIMKMAAEISHNLKGHKCVECETPLRSDKAKQAGGCWDEHMTTCIRKHCDIYKPSNNGETEFECSKCALEIHETTKEEFYLALKFAHVAQRHDWDLQGRDAVREAMKKNHLHCCKCRPHNNSLHREFAEYEKVIQKRAKFSLKKENVEARKAFKGTTWDNLAFPHLMADLDIELLDSEEDNHWKRSIVEEVDKRISMRVRNWKRELSGKELRESEATKASLRERNLAWSAFINNRRAKTSKDGFQWYLQRALRGFDLEDAKYASRFERL